MSILLLVVMWSTFTGIVLVDVRRRSPAVLFGLGLVFAAGLPLSLYLFDTNVEQAVVVDAILYASCFNLLYLVGRILLPGTQVVPSPADGCVPSLPPSEKRLVGLVTVIFLLPFVLKLAEVDFSVGRLMASSWRDVISLGSILMQYAAHMSFGLVLCLFVLRRRGLTGLALAAVTALVIVDRRRVMAVAAVAPLLIYLLFWSLRGRRKSLKIAATIGVGVVALVAFFVVQQIRYLGPLSAAARAEPGVVLSSAVDYILSARGDLSLSKHFLWMMTEGHEVDGYGEMITLRRILAFWLPGGFKPPEFTHSIATAIRGGGNGASIHPTIYGLSWGEAEWLGLLYAPLIAGAFRLLDWVVTTFKGTITWTILLGPYTVLAILTARGTVYNAWVVGLVTTIGLISLIRLSSLRPLRGIPGAEAPAGASGRNANRID